MNEHKKKEGHFNNAVDLNICVLCVYMQVFMYSLPC